MLCFEKNKINYFNFIYKFFGGTESRVVATLFSCPCSPRSREKIFFFLQCQGLSNCVLCFSFFSLSETNIIHKRMSGFEDEAEYQKKFYLENDIDLLMLRFFIFHCDSNCFLFLVAFIENANKKRSLCFFGQSINRATMNSRFFFWLKKAQPFLIKYWAVFELEIKFRFPVNPYGLPRKVAPKLRPSCISCTFKSLLTTSAKSIFTKMFFLSLATAKSFSEFFMALLPFFQNLVSPEKKILYDHKRTRIQVIVQKCKKNLNYFFNYENLRFLIKY
ncbi:hypothetical protein RFI_36387 [Reticulomyxa filosa]|uniref:Uncharacterized protein n=1 Tax=Reticulomyxa filosa TaxID=46433 RepID=X6LGD7_RETFI|nr:hypothetical protein RFI_36387 [Reticulomyxa filosa]|eukprot:ETO01053.1 hypothetical protein RFI_36387 [Reticulomyxa filosa]